MKRNKKGISLITLVITIIIMIILAAAIVLTLTQSGIFDKANDATSKYNLQQVQKIAELAWAEAYADGERDVTKLQEAVNNALQENKLNDKYKAKADEKGVTVTVKKQSTAITLTVADVANIPQESNTTVVDEFGNKIVVPAGFKIRVDDDEGKKGDEKSTAANVTQGIVIEDKDGNQFVWVPVGTIYTTSDAATKEITAKTITLGRYMIGRYYESDERIEVNNYIPDENGVYTPAITTKGCWTDYTPDDIPIYKTYNYFEESATDTGLGQYGNAIARNIDDFKISAIQNGGYYIGRFEAGIENNELVCKSGQTVYGKVKQENASTSCKYMYNDGADGYNLNTFSSDLINSYAWDTAIIFIQTFGGAEAIDYYRQNNSFYFLNNTGLNEDEYCNINDMSGNALEYSTESNDCLYNNGMRIPNVVRGGGLDNYYEDIKAGNSAVRNESTEIKETYSFRPILYVAVAE